MTRVCRLSAAARALLTPALAAVLAFTPAKGPGHRRHRFAQEGEVSCQ